jgi:hypothetical protein
MDWTAHANNSFLVESSAETDSDKGKFGAMGDRCEWRGYKLCSL